MKALGRGPITRLAGAAASPRGAGVVGAIYSRDDWNAGRDVAAEERRCGMVARLSETGGPQRLLSPPPPLSSSSTLPSLHNGTPLLAVVRAQTTDAQVNEVDASDHGAFLERSPRARWRKVSRSKMLLVEDTATPFSDPEKTYTPRVQSYGEYVRRLGKLPEDQPLLRFVMYRDGYSLEAVRHRFQYEIGVSSDAVYLHPPPGGSFASITQFGLAVGVTREQLPHVSRRYNVHPLVFDDRSYHSLMELEKLSAGPRGHLHRVVLRCVTGDEAAVSALLRRLSTDGFINYFGVETFGVGSNTLFDFAASYHSGDVHHAVGGYLQTLAESNPLHHPSYLAYANAEEGTAAGVLGEWLRLCERARLPKKTREVLRSLQHYHNLHHPSLDTARTTAMHAVWDLCGVADRSETSAAAFVWNAMASQRLLSYGSRPVKGDLVRCVGLHGEVQISEVASDVEAAQYTTEDVVLPVPHRERTVPYPTHVVNRALFAEFAAKHHLSFLFEPSAAADSPAPLSAADAVAHYRHVVRRPERLQAAVLRDPSSCTALKSDHFLLQEHQPTESWSLDYERRVREPSPFNVSERFCEKMQYIRQCQPGENTVVLAFALPAESSPWVALREVFDLRYGSFHDLYGVS
ncbi:putative mitochondrial hypothetical protein [Leptomonas pyrrhocoris]|uniref:TRUD domain-containing protein n=1 Tax=Leptomonas pyrrhocoris TaxID=157538 RepID=A0A0M9FW19_LEPPY|nr:putative mitochondrial hypothetical protein [Leptomonas pyrrhocoris]KPA77129.1 putative mitochondrial hypothetical protein [Leptomonas pyrrhocoris]|eukprot:XP_015655568.1 putative mitochondrial hypothetical protein [Leptomonas pyrrhocoris]